MATVVLDDRTYKLLLVEHMDRQILGIVLRHGFVRCLAALLRTCVG